MFVVITQCLGDGEDQDKEDLTNMQLQKRLCWVSTGLVVILTITIFIILL